MNVFLNNDRINILDDGNVTIKSTFERLIIPADSKFNTNKEPTCKLELISKPDILNVWGENMVELIKITPDKQIIFNKKEFPQYGVEEFATAFIDIVEKMSRGK